MAGALNTLAGLRSANEASPTMPTLTRAWYNKTYLTVAHPKLVHDQFGVKTELPKGNGEQVMWRRWLKLNPNTVPLTDGINPTGKTLAYENVLGTVHWYGDWVAITDVVQFMHPDNILTQATMALAKQSAETKDIITRDIINAGTSFLRVSVDDLTGTPTTVLTARTTVGGSITKLALDTAITILEGNDAEYIQPQMNASTKVSTEPLAAGFVAIIHPHVAHDLPNTAVTGMASGEWIPRQKYAAGTVAYPSEIGTYSSVRFITSTLAKVWTGAGVDANNSGTTAAFTYRGSIDNGLADVYSCLILAKDAFGTIKLQGSAQTYYDGPGGNADPLHRKSTAGWKGCWGAAILQDKYMCRIECLARW
jgi:N4-gp56 family major capsid protein